VLSEPRLAGASSPAAARDPPAKGSLANGQTTRRAVVTPSAPAGATRSQATDNHNNNHRQHPFSAAHSDHPAPQKFRNAY